jgi:hypothetical protein
MVGLALITGLSLKLQATNSEIDQAIRLMPIDTETLFVCKTSEVRLEPRPTGTLSMSSFPIGLPESGFKHLKELPVRYIIHGARKFKYPKGIGVGPFEGATVVSMAPKELKASSSFLKHSKLRRKEVKGQEVYAFTEKSIENYAVTYQFCLVKGNLIISTDSNFMSTILERMKAKPIDRALPDTLEEWKYIDRTSGFYALRHINHSTRLTKAGMDMHDEHLRGMSVSATSKKGLRIVSISDNPNGFKIAKSVWSDGELKSVATSLTPTATEIAVSQDEMGKALFYVLLGLGYVIFV